MTLANKDTGAVVLNNVIIELGGDIVGGANSLSFNFSRSDEALYQAGGGAYAYGIRQGSVSVSGSIDGLWLNNSSFNGVDFETGYSPYVDIIGFDSLTEQKVKIKDAIINDFSTSLSLGTEATVSRSFTALRIVK